MDVTAADQRRTSPSRRLEEIDSELACADRRLAARDRQVRRSGANVTLSAGGTLLALGMASYLLAGRRTAILVLTAAAAFFAGYAHGYDRRLPDHAGR